METIGLRSVGALACAIALSASSSFAQADAQAGLDAYARGNYADALRLLVPAADQDARAASALARMFEDGLGVERDSYQAVMWRRKAAELGDRASQRALGDMYTRGSGVVADPREASVWYQRAGKAAESAPVAELSVTGSAADSPAQAPATTTASSCDPPSRACPTVEYVRPKPQVDYYLGFNYGWGPGGWGWGWPWYGWGPGWWGGYPGYGFNFGVVIRP